MLDTKRAQKSKTKTTSAKKPIMAKLKSSDKHTKTTSVKKTTPTIKKHKVVTKAMTTLPKVTKTKLPAKKVA